MEQGSLHLPKEQSYSRPMCSPLHTRILSDSSKECKCLSLRLTVQLCKVYVGDV